MSHFYRTFPISVGMHVPSELVTNEQMTEFVNTTDEWIQTRSGIKQRYYAEEGISTSDMAVKAAEEAIAKAGLKPEDIDLILAATLSPDYFFPGIGVMIQNKLNMRTIPAIDLRGQCSGFSWAMSTADGYGKLGQYKNILVVGAEKHSSALDYSRMLVGILRFYLVMVLEQLFLSLKNADQISCQLQRIMCQV